MALSVNERVRSYRRAMAEAGMRPVQIWVPDVRRPGFVEECRRQSRMLQKDSLEQEMLQFIEAAMDTEGWE